MASSTTLLCTAVVLLVGTRALIGGDRGTAVTAVAAPKHRHPYLSLRLRGGSGAPGYGPLNVGTPQGDASDRLLDPEFLAAAAYARQLPGLSAEDKLTFYGLYKQATVGVCNVPRPSRFAWGETAKWQHWHGHGDMDPVVAARKYVEHLDSMQPEWRTSVHPPQFENMGADGEDSSVHLSSSSEREADTPSWFRDQTSRRDSSSGDSPWEEDGEGERTAERGGKGDKDEADTQAGMLRMHQRMRLMAPTVPPSGKGIPELGLRPVHEEHADQLRYAELMDMLVLQHQGKYVAALEENGEEINAFLRHFYERLVNVSNLVPYKIPARNLSLTGQELEEAKKERAYLWQILTSDIDLPVANASSPDDIIDQRFEAEDCMVEQWLCLRDRYVSLMGQIGDFQITSGPEGEGERGPSLPDGSTPRTEAELAKAARRAARDEVKRHKLEVELMLNADVMLWAVSGTASRRPCDGSFGRCEVLKVGTLVEGEYSEIERDWMTGSRQRFHRGQEAMSWARVAAGSGVAYYRLYVVGGFDLLRNRSSAIVESIDPFGCCWRREADLPLARAELGVAATQRTPASDHTSPQDEPPLLLYAIGGWMPSGGGAASMPARGLKDMGDGDTHALEAEQMQKGVGWGGVAAGIGGSGSGSGGEGAVPPLCRCQICKRVWGGPDAEWRARELARTVAEPASAWDPEPGSTASDQVDVYDTKRNEWRHLSNLHLPAPRAGAGVVELEGRIYVCGGSDGEQAVSTVWSVDPMDEHGEWREEASLRQARCGIAGACVPVVDARRGISGIMVCGGRKDAGIGKPEPAAVLNSVEFFSLHARAWQKERPLRFERYKVGCASFDGRVFVVGGCDAFGTPLLDVFSYRPGDKYWREEASLHRARAGHVAGILRCPERVRGVTPDPDSDDPDHGIVRWNTTGGFGGREEAGKIQEAFSQGPH